MEKERGGGEKDRKKFREDEEERENEIREKLRERGSIEWDEFEMGERRKGEGMGIEKMRNEEKSYIGISSYMMCVSSKV